MKETTLFVYFIVFGAIILIVGGAFIFYSGQESLKKDCNGTKIGQEQSGQERTIWKCYNGEIRIF